MPGSAEPSDWTTVNAFQPHERAAAEMFNAVLGSPAARAEVERATELELQTASTTSPDGASPVGAPVHASNHPVHPVVDALRTLRVRRNLTQAELAGQMLVTRETVLSWERGSRIPTLAALTAWCTNLDVQLTITGTAVAETDEVNAVLIESGISYPLGSRDVHDLAMQRDGQTRRAEEAEAERDQGAEKLAVATRTLADVAAQRDGHAGANSILRGLLSEFVDDNPCAYDHHGYCQTHSLSAHPCRNARARQLIGALGAPA